MGSIAAGEGESADLPQSGRDRCEFSASNIQLAQLGLENWLSLVNDSSSDSASNLETELTAALESLKSIEGSCSLAVELLADRQSGLIEVDYEGAVAGLKVIGSTEDDGERVLCDADELKIAARVKFDLVGNRAKVEKFSFAGPGVFVAGMGDCVIGEDDLSNAVVRIAEGVIEPSEIIEALGLWREVEQLGIEVVDGKMEFSGIFTSDFSDEQRQSKIGLEINATELEMSWGNWDKSAGEILTVKLASEFDRSAGLFRVDALGWQCGGVQGVSQLKAQLLNPEAPIEQLAGGWEFEDFSELPERLSEIFQQVELGTIFKVADMAVLEDVLLETEADDLPAINLTANGPMDGRLFVGLNQNQAKVECRLNFPGETEFACRRGLAAKELGEIEEFPPGILSDGYFNLDDDLRLGGIRGSAGLQGELSWDEAGEKYNFKTAMDLSGAEFFIESVSGDLSERLMHKSAGELLRIEGVLAGDNKSKTIRLKPFTLQVGRSSLQAGVLLKGVNLADLTDRTASAQAEREDGYGEVDLDVTVDIPDVAGAVRWFDKLSDLDLAGRLRADGGLVLQLLKKPKVLWKPGRVDGAVSWMMEGEPAEFELSHVEFSPGRLYVPAATVRLGKNHLSLVADVSRSATSDQTATQATDEQLGFQGRVDVLSDYLNLDDLKKYAEWLGLESTAVDFDEFVVAAEEATAAVESGDVEAVEKVIAEAITADETAIQDSGEKDKVRQKRARALLRQCSVAGSCDIGQLCYTDPATGAFMELQQLRGGYELAEGVFQAQILAGLGGGVVELTVKSVLDADEPVIEYHQAAREMSANESLRVVVESEFPGLEVTGTISEKKDLRVALRHVLAGGMNWQGSGVTKCLDGTLYGPGGPNWLIKVFPGLRLVEYKWREMTNQYDCYPDGSKKNHMLFDGQRYDIYITGLSQPVTQQEQYDAVMEKLRQDLQASRDQLTRLDQGRLKLPQEKARRLRELAQELEKLWQRHENGEKLRVSEADYIVGAQVSGKTEELFDKPREFLRVPIFYSHSFVVERAMVGIETSNAAVGAMKQIMKKVETKNLINLLNGSNSNSKKQ